MGDKNLKVRVDVDTAAAKRKLRELRESSGGAAADPASPAAPSPAAGFARAAQQVRSFGDEAKSAQVNLKAAGKAFAGLAVGMAASYAAKSMPAGRARDAVEYGSAAVSGAAAGMMFGPVGAALGGVAGLLKTYLDKEGVKAQASRDFMRGEHDYRDARAFRKTLDDLTEVGDAFEYLDRNLVAAKRELERYQQVEQTLIAKVKQFREKGDEESAKLEEGYLGANRSRQQSLEAVVKSLERQRQARDKVGEARGGMTGTDALAKVGGTAYRTSAELAAATTAEPLARSGGSFFFSVPSSRAASLEFGGRASGDNATDAIKKATELSARLDEEMVKALKEISENTKNGGDSSWQ